MCVHASMVAQIRGITIESGQQKRWIFFLFFVLWNPQEQIHLRRCPSCDDIEIVWPGCRERNRGKKRRFLNLFTPCECLYGSAEIERERSEFLCAVLGSRSISHSHSNLDLCVCVSAWEKRRREKKNSGWERERAWFALTNHDSQLGGNEDDCHSKSVP